MHWSVFSAVKTYLQKHYGVEDGFYANCFLIARQSLIINIWRCWMYVSFKMFVLFDTVSLSLSLSPPSWLFTSSLLISGFIWEMQRSTNPGDQRFLAWSTHHSTAWWVEKVQKRQVNKQNAAYVELWLWDESDTKSLLTVIEAPSPQKDPISVILQLDRFSSNGRIFVLHFVRLADDTCD